jgi:thiosulfate/3-mercaptopyruvate sulfurtransferase
MQWATRIWYMLYSLGFDNVSILNGGFSEWTRLDLPIEIKKNIFEPANFKSKIKIEKFIDKDEILKTLTKNSSLLVNALTEDIHSGNNPRYGRPGRIPSSINIPFHNFLELNTGKFKSIKIIINYCGGGIAATLNAFALFQAGFIKFKVYDNSMSEWAMDETLPIEID